MSNVVGERNMFDKMSTEMTTMIDQAAKRIETMIEKNDIIDAFIQRESGLLIM